jgi:hypothetical protein
MQTVEASRRANVKRSPPYEIFEAATVTDVGAGPR